jgi:hypothetical protein
VPAGKKTVKFTVHTSSVATTTQVLISAGYSNHTRSATLTIQQAALASVSLTPASVIGGSKTQCTVSLSGPAPTGGAVCALTTSFANGAPVPASITIPAGKSSATFTIATKKANVNVLVTITATYNGVTQSGQVELTHSPALAELTINPTTVKGGKTATGTVTLNAPAPKSGLVVTLKSDTPGAANVPASVTVPAKSTTATFTVTTNTVTSNTAANISAVGNFVRKVVTITVTP